MKKIDLKCPSCGGIMKISEDKTEAVCPFCKYKFFQNLITQFKI